MVKWQNTGEVPVVRKGRRRDEDTELGDTSPKTVWRMTVGTTMQVIS